jgi:hypothetical protein
VTVHRTRDLKRELMTLAEPFGARLVDIKITGGGHFCATIACGASTFDIYTGWSPSDWRAARKRSSFVKRKLRELTGGNRDHYHTK